MSDRPRHREPLAVVEEAPDTPVGEHTHEQPRSPLVTVLTVVVVLLSIAVGWLGYNVYRLQQGQGETTAYIEDARGRRDGQNAELNRRVDRAVCDVLDQLPAGGLFDPIRAQYGCGPGIPVEQLNPDAAQNLADIIEQGQAAVPTPAAPEPAEPTSAPDEMPPGAPAGAQPSPMGQAPTTTAAPVTPAPAAPTTPPAAATTPPPLVDLSTVTDRVCNALGICL